MKRATCILLLALLFPSYIFAQSVSTQDVDGRVECKCNGRICYMTVSVGHSPSYTVYNQTYLSASSTMPVTTMLTDEDKEILISSLKKSCEWAVTAEKEQLEIDKELCVCAGVIATFISKDKGNQVEVSIYLQDLRNQFIHTLAYLNIEQIKQLIGMLEKTPEAFAKLAGREKKAEILQ